MRGRQLLGLSDPALSLRTRHPVAFLQQPGIGYSLSVAERADRGDFGGPLAGDGSGGGAESADAERAGGDGVRFSARRIGFVVGASVVAGTVVKGSAA